MKRAFRPRTARRRLAVAALVVGIVCPRVTGAEPDAPTAFARAKVEALLRDRLPCLGCHAWGAEGGRIGPDLRTVRDRKTAVQIAAVIDDPARMTPDSPMPKVALGDETRDLLVRVLAGGHVPRVAAAGLEGGAASPSDVRAIYAKRCAPCHGSRGTGDGPNAARLPIRPTDHSDARILSNRSDDALFDTISAGGLVMNKSARMPGFGESLSRQEIRGLVRYLRELCRCEEPPWAKGRDAK